MCVDGVPYIVPVNYGYKDQKLYIHSAKTGKKMEYVEKNNLVCFEIEGAVEIIEAGEACSWSTRYRSVIGYGRASVTSGRESIEEALDIIMKHQSGREGWAYPDSNLDDVAIIEIEIEDMTGKKSGY